MALTKAQLIDLNGNELILDLDADTSITADTDDQIDVKIGGADDLVSSLWSWHYLVSDQCSLSRSMANE